MIRRAKENKLTSLSILILQLLRPEERINLSRNSLPHPSYHLLKNTLLLPSHFLSRLSPITQPRNQTQIHIIPINHDLLLCTIDDDIAGGYIAHQLFEYVAW